MSRMMWDQHMDAAHLRDMAQHIWGDDARAMMQEFQPSADMLIKYDHNIVRCESALRGKRVLDMGCNHGIYSYAALRHGATHVVGVEPRGMFVSGLNAFAQQHDLAMEFHRAYDTDMPRLLREHDIDTVILMSVDSITNWENMMYDLRRSEVQRVIMQATTIPDTWIEFNKEVYDYAKSGDGMPAGFTLHFDAHNSGTRAGMNPLNRDRADPDTGFQHIAPDGTLDVPGSHYFQSMRSRAYMRGFIEHTGFTVLHSRLQDKPTASATSRSLEHGLYQWYLLSNEK